MRFRAREGAAGLPLSPSLRQSKRIDGFNQSLAKEGEDGHNRRRPLGQARGDVCANELSRLQMATGADRCDGFTRVERRVGPSDKSNDLSVCHQSPSSPFKAGSSPPMITVLEWNEKRGLLSMYYERLCGNSIPITLVIQDYRFVAAP